METSDFASEETPIETALRLLDEGAPGKAVDVLDGLVAEGRGGLLARLTLARALLAAGQTGQAVAVARETAALHPDVGDAALGLGAALLAAEQLPTAIAEFQRVLRLDPGNGEARYLLGCAWLEAGEPDPALAAFEALEEMPGLADRIAEAQAMKARPRSDAGYVRHLFDQFSIDYDSRMLGQLAYQAPVILRELAALVMPGQIGLQILDLGCGTGLSGAAFKDRAAHLTGIDLSPAMIEKARQRGVYDTLAVGDIEAGLGQAAYDLVVAADTLVYLGDLDAVFAKVGAALRPGAMFLFTVEAMDGDGFELGPKRRWRHSQAYLRAMAARHRLAVTGLMGCEPRHEAHVPVPGFAVALTKGECA
jgi:predicted TPR repeat methyltransferase